MDEMKQKSSQKSTDSTPETTVIKTPRSSYRFTSSWLEHDGLKDILVGLVSDDFKNGPMN